MLDDITLDHSRSKTTPSWIKQKEDDWRAKSWTRSHADSFSWAVKASRVNWETHHSPQLISTKKTTILVNKWSSLLLAPKRHFTGHLQSGAAIWCRPFTTTKFKHSVHSWREWNWMPTCFSEWLSNTDRVKIKVILINPLLLSSP